MGIVNSLSLCARITIDLHSLNNEGTEGNQQQTRMVHIVDQSGKRAVVNAISGDMFKHILIEHLIPLLKSANQALCSGAEIGDPDRINRDLLTLFKAVSRSNSLRPSEKAWLEKAVSSLSRGIIPATPSTEEPVEEEETEGEGEGEAEQEKTKGPKPTPPSAQILTQTLDMCALTDLAGTLITMKRPGLALGRKSVIEFGWVVGLPSDGDNQPLTATEQYFHVKYAPEGRQAAAGGETVAGKQAIFHRPASSGVYALICNLDLYRIGQNDITRAYVLSNPNRVKRAKALIHALTATLVKPAGAQRNTQNPHIVSCEGIVARSSNSLPAPTVSPLNENYRDQMDALAGALNRIQGGAMSTARFDNLADGANVLTDIAAQVELPGE